MNNSRVFIVQVPVRMDRKLNKMVPKLDFSSAQKYGQLVPLLSHTAAPFNNESIVKELNEKLITFNNNDYLLMVGNPTLIGMACAVAAHHNNGSVNALQWHGMNKSYTPIRIGDMFCELEQE